jgi:hypothetical protein
MSVTSWLQSSSFTRRLANCYQVLVVEDYDLCAIGGISFLVQCTVNNRIPDKSSFQMLDLRPVVEWSDNRMPFKNQMNLSGFQTVQYWNNHYENWIYLSGFGMVQG